MSGSRAYIEQEVAERARHSSLEDVRTTFSFARAERLFGREYHGRFLIELLQNAADAWREDLRSRDGSRCEVAVVVTSEPALLVANQGAPMPPEVVIGSLGHIGATTKPEGEAIGHKGIGFKSVLEVALTPEIYSGLGRTEGEVAVRFDPERALDLIIEATPTWSSLAETLADPSADPLDPVPVLRYPLWQDVVPPDVTRLLDAGFDTVVRLPFDGRFAKRLDLDEQAWLSAVREAIDGVTDQIVLLLGGFDRVTVSDEPAGLHTIITPEWEREARAVLADATVETVTIRRNDELSSRWRLVRRNLPDLEGLASEVAVGLRLGDESDRPPLEPAVAGHASSPFHLFFPTRIGSGLPFLLHGYFEVDAARQSFYRGSTDRNRTILAELAALVATAVNDAAESGSVDMVSVVDLVAAAGEPEDELAREFRKLVLHHLDGVAWIPVEDGPVGVRTPHQLVISTPDLTRLIADVFPNRYVAERVGLALPMATLSDRALDFLASRLPDDAPDVWDVVTALMLPGESMIWEPAAVDRSFVRLLDLLAALQVQSRSRTEHVVAELQGHPDSRLLPALGNEGSRVFLPIPDPSEAAPGRRSLMVMARARATERDSLVPPDGLDLAFLPEGLLSNEQEIDRAKPLGVRPFTVDNVVDRLNGIQQGGIDPEQLLTFLWDLLHRERLSSFGTRRSAERSVTFDPHAWFWCQPDRADDETDRVRQQRERYLSHVHVPCRDGQWRPAGEVAFGRDWADWLSQGAPGGVDHPATVTRVAAYEALERIAPDDRSLLASPAILIQYLKSSEIPHLDEEDQPEVLNEEQRNAERLAFLLRLGVWEVPPLLAFQSRERARESPFPWHGKLAEQRAEMVAARGGWTFGTSGWSGARHKNVYMAEDYRFLWPLPAMAQRDPEALAIALDFGSHLYAERLTCRVFCGACRDEPGSHSTMRSSSALDDYPSLLRLELHHEPWIVCHIDELPLDTPVEASVCWWHSRPPQGSGMRQSPYRYLPLCSPDTGVTEVLRSLAHVPSLVEASLGQIRTLLTWLRNGFERGALPIEPLSSGSAKQAFVGLHRLAYARLAELQDPEGVRAVIDDVGVLCELGEQLVYRLPEEARHNDGRFLTYARFFNDRVPFVAVPREWSTAHLGVPPLFVHLERVGEDEGRDVTSEVRSVLGDRIPELLAIMVHHSLGAQTLDLAGQEFEARARRLQALTVCQLDDLVVNALVDGLDIEVTIGSGSNQDLFLQGPTTTAPVLFHDLDGHGWQDLLRRKIAPYLATVLENPAYAATIALFLQAETDTDREEFLLDLGITSDDVDAVSARIGAVSAEDRERHLQWFTAVLDALGADSTLDDLNRDTIATALEHAGLARPESEIVADAGGGRTVRTDVGDGSPLRILARRGVVIERLDDALRARGEAGIDIPIGRRLLRRWLDLHGRHCAALIATTTLAAEAKSLVASIVAPTGLSLVIDPTPAQYLAPVMAVLHTCGFDMSPDQLAHAPTDVLKDAGKFTSRDAFDDAALLLYDEEERERLLRDHAARWRRELRFLGVLVRTGAAETRAGVRAADQLVDGLLPQAPSKPTDLEDSLAELLPDHEPLARQLSAQMDDGLLGTVPSRHDVLELAEQFGVAIDRVGVVERALDAPRLEHARAVMRRSSQLSEHSLAPRPPTLEATQTGRKKRPTTTSVSKVKVEPSTDRRKRELGSEGEEWALAAVVGGLLELSLADRNAALDEIASLLAIFNGPPVAEALTHFDLARGCDLEPEELVDELAALLHVSEYSDTFGFDMLGWMAPDAQSLPRAMCLEVKSTSGSSFALSAGEWERASMLNQDDLGDRYAVLVVRRQRRGGVPAGLDLLVDPVDLVARGLLMQEVDGYRMGYRHDAK